jgi:hypothetical protein
MDELGQWQIGMEQNNELTRIRQALESLDQTMMIHIALVGLNANLPQLEPTLRALAQTKQSLRSGTST